MKYITMTTASTTVNARVWSDEEEKVITMTCNVSDKLHAEKELKQRFGDNLAKLLPDTFKATVPKKYRMSEDKYFMLATVAEKRPNGAYISRTATANKLTCILYNAYTDDTETRTFYKNGKDLEKCIKAIKHDLKNTDMKFIKVKEKETTTALYIMTVEKFIQNGEEITE